MVAETFPEWADLSKTPALLTLWLPVSVDLFHLYSLDLPEQYLEANLVFNTPYLLPNECHN